MAKVIVRRNMKRKQMKHLLKLLLKSIYILLETNVYHTIYDW